MGLQLSKNFKGLDVPECYCRVTNLNFDGTNIELQLGFWANSQAYANRIPAIEYQSFQFLAADYSEVIGLVAQTVYETMAEIIPNSQIVSDPVQVPLEEPEIDPEPAEPIPDGGTPGGV